MALSSWFSYHWSFIIFNLKLLNYKLQIITYNCNNNFNLHLCAFSAFLMLVQSNINLLLQIERQVKPFSEIIIFIGFLIFSHIRQNGLKHKFLFLVILSYFFFELRLTFIYLFIFCILFLFWEERKMKI